MTRCWPAARQYGTMHELAVCQDLIAQAESVARERGAQAITRIELDIGPLSGVEAPLLEQAFSIARAGTLANKAALQIDNIPIRVRCQSCHAEGDARANRLVCPACGDWHTELLSGDEMLLRRLELDVPTPFH